jgi:hypothetical protein
MGIFNACSLEDDYSDIVFKNYLSYEIKSAESLVAGAIEGTNEGEYQSGAKQTYQNSIEESKLVENDPGASQLDVDETYSNLLDAGDDFFDQMVPFRSKFTPWIEYANELLTITEEGVDPGNVKAGNIDLLKDAVNAASKKLESADLTQKELDLTSNMLTEAIYHFNSELVEYGLIRLSNYGFEIPGEETSDFSLVEGWELYGNSEEWAPKAAIAKLDSAPEGMYIAKIGSYTQGLYQTTPELLNPSSDYELKYNVSLISNDPDWQGKKFPAIIRSRIIVFEKETGDYDFINVIGESYDTLGINPTDFIEMNITFSTDAISSSIGKNVVIDFDQRHTWDASAPIWAESFVGIDEIELKRKYKSN